MALRGSVGAGARSAICFFFHPLMDLGDTKRMNSTNAKDFVIPLSPSWRGEG